MGKVAHDAAPAIAHGHGQLDRFRRFIDEDRLGEERVRAARMDRDFKVRDLAHPFRMRPGDALAEIAVGTAGIDAVHVERERIERIAAIAVLEGHDVEHRHHDQRARKLCRIDFLERDAAGHRPFRLVAMDGAIDPEHRARIDAVDDDHGDLDLAATGQFGNRNDAAHDGAGSCDRRTDGDGFGFRHAA
nr:hypothetical protein [Devosia aurantiaca]